MTTNQIAEMERRDSVRMAVLAVILVANVVVWAACQQPPINGQPGAAQTPVQLGAVTADGSCRGSLGLDLQVGLFAVPLRATLDTHASPSGAAGVVSVDVAGLLQARCTVVEGVGSCAVSGLLAPRTNEAMPALNGGGDDTTKP